MSDSSEKTTECPWIEYQLQYTGPWNDISAYLSENLTPFVYGRFVQFVIDFPSLGYNHRNDDMLSHISDHTPDDIVKEARSIIEQLINQIVAGRRIDNEICSFGTELEAKDHRDDYMLYLGRCVQFLLNKGKSYTMNGFLTCSRYEVIFNLAHELKQEILIRENGPYKLKDYICEGEDDSSGACYWDGESKRCMCGNRRCTFSHEQAYLDDTYPSGEVEGY